MPASLAGRDLPSVSDELADRPPGAGTYEQESCHRDDGERGHVRDSARRRHQNVAHELIDHPREWTGPRKRPELRRFDRAAAVAFGCQVSAQQGLEIEYRVKNTPARDHEVPIETI